MQPIRRFGFDAAILFSDILVVPDALGQKVSFEVNEGPRLEPIAVGKGFRQAAARRSTSKRLAPVFETIERVKAALPATTALIGFCGAPWTVASYMIAGRGTPDQAPARLFAYREPELFQRLIDRLVEASVDYLARQIESGVEAVQIFDSWAGVLPAGEYERWCLAPIRQIVAGVRRASQGCEGDRLSARESARASMISPRKRASTRLGSTAPSIRSGRRKTFGAPRRSRAISIRWRCSPAALRSRPARARILKAFRGRPHIFNLGHGVAQQTPLAHVEALMRLVRGQGAS